MLFVHYPKCTTCQKAKAYLDERGAAYDARDIKLENPSAEELRAWWQRSGLPLKRFFNTSGLQYKALGLKDKLPSMSEEEQLQLLATDGMLVKRPILVGGDFVRVGFRPAESVLKVDRKFSGSRRAIIHQRRSQVNHRGGELKLRVILDRFSAEVFVNDGEQVMSVVLYTEQGADGISFIADGTVSMDVTKYDLV